MHFLITWEIVKPVRRKEEVILDIVGCFSGFKFSKVLESTYVIGVDSAEDVAVIRDRLVEVAKLDPHAFYFIVSPANRGGRYDGWIPGNVWPEVNKISGALADV